MHENNFFPDKNTKKVWIETYGCQMNKAESGAFKILFKNAGWELADDEKEADLVLLNTCSVRETAEQRIWGRIGHFRHLKKTRKITLVITGCMAERLKASLHEKTPEIDFVLGNFQKQKLLDICEDALNGRPAGSLNADREYSFYTLHKDEGFKAYVPIMHGCNNFCSYCIVPYVRGREISRSPSEIFSEIRELDHQNVREITLLGQNVNSYHYIQNGTVIDFTKILEMILDRLSSIRWVRFLTSHPKDISQSLIDLIAGQEKLCKHIHLPVQHGSDAVLKRMKRGYTSGDYRNLVERIKKRIGNISLTTDILIGFPGETEEDFQATLSLIKDVEFDDAFMYRYNRREGTLAATFNDEIDISIQLKRLQEIIALQQEISVKKKKKKIGSTLEALVESISKKEQGELLGRTEQDEMVVFPGKKEMVGKFVNLLVESLQGKTLRGREIICPGD